MGLFGDDHQNAQDHKDYQDAPKHKSHVSHELIAGAAAYEASKKYEQHVAANGKPASHAKAKELMAGFGAGFIDKQVETHGLDFIDKEKAQHEAKKRGEEGLAGQY